MTIEFQPPSLGSILRSVHGEDRVKNREGYATFEDSFGAPTQPPTDGTIPELYRIAQDYDALNPTHRVTLYEHGCTGTGVPSALLVSE